MSDTKKTKAELIRELASLRRKIAASCDSAGKAAAASVRKNARRKPRRAITADIEFIGDFDIVKAHGVNISSGGICLHMNSNMPFELKLYEKGKLRTYRAELVWLKQLSTGEYHFGFKFINDNPLPEF